MITAASGALQAALGSCSQAVARPAGQEGHLLSSQEAWCRSRAVCSSSGSSAGSGTSVALPTNRATDSLGVLLLLLWLSAGDRPLGPARAAAAGGTTVQSPAGTIAQNEVAATVGRVLASGEHPGLNWSAIPDVVDKLKPLYEAEADRLLWFNGTTPGPLLQRGADGDCRRRRPRPRCRRLRCGVPRRTLGLHQAKTATGPGARPLRSGSERRRGAHDQGACTSDASIRRRCNWGYDIAAKPLDVTGGAREARQGKGLGAALDALEPRGLALRAREEDARHLQGARDGRRAASRCRNFRKGRRRSNRASPGPASRSSRRGCGSSAIFRRRGGHGHPTYSTRRSSRR